MSAGKTGRQQRRGASPGRAARFRKNAQGTTLNPERSSRTNKLRPARSHRRPARSSSRPTSSPARETRTPEPRPAPAATWNATYRLQLHRDFPLAAAAKLLPYLAQLGISHVYLSPCLQARPGSTHGYDVADPRRVSDDLGGEPAWRQFSAAARAAGLGVLLDIVPNHMAAGMENPWWEDLLEHGPFSEYVEFFDVAPSPHSRLWHIHLPTLGRPYGESLEAGLFTVTTEGPRPRLVCEGQGWPLNPGTWSLLLEDQDLGLSAATELNRLTAIPDPSSEERRRYRDLAREIAEHWEAIPAARRSARAEQFRTQPDLMHQLIRRQWYSLHGWRLAGEIVNFRRFFDISTLVGMRMENERVFTASHSRIVGMLAAGEIQGLRIDHPDGLASPAGYFQRLRGLLPPGGRIYAEKILAEDEPLRTEWAVDGTVGYEFLSRVNRLWMRENRSDQLSAIYADFTGHTINLPEVVREKKAQIIDSAFLVDLDRIAGLATGLARESWRTQDLSRRDLRTALREMAVLLPVYRTYLGSGAAGEVDREMVARVIAAARARLAQLPAGVFDFLAEQFTTPDPSGPRRELITRWQQLTPAVTAKGIEDTTFYCYDRLVSCNEVGAQASLIGISSEQFHQFCHRTGARWPRALLSTATHDTKRGEDVRARISVLTEDPDAWAQVLQKWSGLNLPAWRGRTPDRHAEYLLYQTLVGAWPIERERTTAYMLKACREAKINTSWHEPNTGYEEMMGDFIAGLYDSKEFIGNLAAFVDPLVLPGRINGLAQTLIRLTAPGMPDNYQGTELWDMSLVDPDNRRPVDFPLRQRLLRAAADKSAADVLQDWDSGLPKLWLIARTLQVRRENAAWFASGSYTPLSAQGSRLGHLLAFMREERAITVVPRFTFSLRGQWGDTTLRLPAGTWHNRFTDARHTGDTLAADLLRDFPVALLTLDAG